MVFMGNSWSLKQKHLSHWKILSSESDKIQFEFVKDFMYPLWGWNKQE